MKPIDIDVKRFYIPGVVLKATAHNAKT